ncbi:MAG: hypothetical protein M3139_05405 [Bacteroidota bacterium]|nr:hypothetical protein [Bacteroidota bacterium]
MDELAGYYPNPDDDNSPRGHFGGGIAVATPKWWWGFILRQLQPEELEAIKGLNDVINGNYDLNFNVRLKHRMQKEENKFH